MIVEVFWLSDDVGSDVFQLNVGQAGYEETHCWQCSLMHRKLLKWLALFVVTVIIN